MPRLLPTIIFFIFLNLPALAQQSRDFIAVKKKNGITLKSFTAGSAILFNTKAGKSVEGYIQKIKYDTVWVTAFNIQIVPTRLGVTMVDTVSAYVIKTHYRDIASIYIPKKTKRLPLLASKVLFFGGTGFIGLNTVNHVLDGDMNLYTEKANYQRLVRAGIAAAAGYAGLLLFRKAGFSRKHHKIVYINLE